MHSNIRRKAVLAVTAVAVAAFAGGAYAATQESSASGPQAFLNDVAKRLHVTPAQLQTALKGAAVDQLNAAVAAGKLTQAEANSIKQHIQQGGGFPPFPGLFFGAPGGPGPQWRIKPPFPPMLPNGQPAPNAPRFFPGPPSMLPRPALGPYGAAAKYLGLTDAQLLGDLTSGKSLAAIARSQGKSTAGLKAAMTASIKTKLDKAVAAKMLTSAQEQRILQAFSARLDELIQRTPQARGGRPFVRPGMRLFPLFGAAAKPGPAVPVPAGPARPAGPIA
jgi:hypothetical protein